MTKNRFLSKRLACLLTTALIASPIYIVDIKSVNAAVVVQSTGNTTAYAADTDDIELTGTTALTTLAGADTITT
jgi:hypothetical protein